MSLAKTFAVSVDALADTLWMRSCLYSLGACKSCGLAHGLHAGTTAHLLTRAIHIVRQRLALSVSRAYLSRVEETGHGSRRCLDFLLGHRIKSAGSAKPTRAGNPSPISGLVQHGDDQDELQHLFSDTRSCKASASRPFSIVLGFSCRWSSSTCSMLATWVLHR